MGSFGTGARGIQAAAVALAMLSGAAAAQDVPATMELRAVPRAQQGQQESQQGPWWAPSQRPARAEKTPEDEKDDKFSAYLHRFCAAKPENSYWVAFNYTLAGGGSGWDGMPVATKTRLSIADMGELGRQIRQGGGYKTVVVASITPMPCE